jgi:hypothetical protein
VDSLPKGATTLYPAGDWCLGYLDGNRLVAPDARALAKRDPLWFRKLFAQASARWGLGRENVLGERIAADTGELVWDMQDGVMTVRAPCVVGATGFLSGRDVDLGEFSLELGTRFATVLAVSLDGRSLAESKRALLATVARAENTDQVWSRNRTRVEPDGRGHAPILAEPVTGRIHFRRAPRRIQALAANGLPVGEPLPITGGAVALPADRCRIWYLLER